MLYFYIEYEFMTYTSFQVMLLLLSFLINKDLSGWLLWKQTVVELISVFTDVFMEEVNNEDIIYG